MEIIKVAYMPHLEGSTLMKIQKNVTPSMFSNDGSSNQYLIDIILTDLTDLPVKDYKCLNDLELEGVNYIEI